MIYTYIYIYIYMYAVLVYVCACMIINAAWMNSTCMCMFRVRDLLVMTSPKTECLSSRCEGAPRVMKNCEPVELGRLVLAVDRM